VVIARRHPKPGISRFTPSPSADSTEHVRAFGYTVAARYLDNSEEMVRERYSHIEAGELGDVTTEALDEIDF